MRVAMLGTRGMPATHGGVERAVEELSVRLAARGHSVTVFCRNGYCGRREPVYRGVRLRYLPAIPTRHLEAASHSLLAAAAAAAGSFDVVHIHSVGPALFAWIPRLAGKRVIVTVHALDWRRRKWGPLARLALRAGAWMAARCAHATIAVSRSSRSYLHERLRLRAIHVPNGVALRPDPPAGSGGVAGRTGGPPPAAEGPYLLFLGRLVPEKRVEDLVAAFRASDTNARLLIAGDGHRSGSYPEAIRRCAAGDRRIRLLGGVYGTLKEDLIAGAAALVNPSELEGHPIVVLEALAHGVPVLVSDIAEHRDILEGEGATASLGVRFRTGDREDLRRAIGRVMALPLDAAARAGRRDFVRRHFDWDRIATATEEVYAAAARGGPEMAVARAAAPAPGAGEPPC